MARIVLSGVPPFDGEHDFDVAREYNGHELHLIKQVAGVRLGEIEDAAKAGDYDLFVSFAVITLWRSGKIKKQDIPEVTDMLLAATTSSITFDFGEADALPPAETSPSKPASSDEHEPNKKTSSDSLSPTGDDPPATIPTSIGQLG